MSKNNAYPSIFLFVSIFLFKKTNRNAIEVAKIISNIKTIVQSKYIAKTTLSKNKTIPANMMTDTAFLRDNPKSINL